VGSWLHPRRDGGVVQAVEVGTMITDHAARQDLIGEPFRIHLHHGPSRHFPCVVAVAALPLNHVRIRGGVAQYPTPSPGDGLLKRDPDGGDLDEDDRR